MKTLRFRKDGTLTIVQFTDLHWNNGEPEDIRTRDLMNAVLEAEKPDLAVLTGDVIYSPECAAPVRSYREVVRIVEEHRLPWAAVFGNHDAERGCSKPDLVRVQQDCPYNMNVPGRIGFGRWGNGVLPVLSSAADNPRAALYLLDSGAYSPLPFGGYAWVTHRQIRWYRKEAQRLAARNGGEPLPALAFFHIPLPEYREVWERRTCYGVKYEGVGCPRRNSGLFAAFRELGDVVGTFVGHDHINDYWGELDGIRLCYGRATGYNTYGREGFPRGARIIRLTEGERAFETWLRLDDGTVVKEQQIHLPEHDIH